MNPYQPFGQAWNPSSPVSGHPTHPTPPFPHMANWQPGFSQMMGSPRLSGSAVTPPFSRDPAPGQGAVRQRRAGGYASATGGVGGYAPATDGVGGYAPATGGVGGYASATGRVGGYASEAGGVGGYASPAAGQGHPGWMTESYYRPVYQSDYRTAGYGLPPPPSSYWPPDPRFQVSHSDGKSSRRKQTPRKVEQLVVELSDDEEVGVKDEPSLPELSTAPAVTDPSPANRQISRDDNSHMDGTVSAGNNSAGPTSSMPADSTCPEDGPGLQLSIASLDIQEVLPLTQQGPVRPLADYTIIGSSDSEPDAEFHIERVKSVSIDHLPRLTAASGGGGRVDDCEGAPSVECESFHTSSPDHGAVTSEVEEPDDVVIDAQVVAVHRPRKEFGESASSDKKDYACLEYGCDHVSDCKPEMRRHMEDHVKLRPTRGKFKCMLCPFTNNHRVALAIHSVVHNELPPYACVRCNRRQFNTERSLNMHISVHTGETKYSCTYESCTYTSNHSSNMNRHYRMKHSFPIPAPPSLSLMRQTLRCPHCSFTSKHSIALEIHAAVHEGVPPYRCARCPNAYFARVSQLSLHIQSHTGEVDKFSCGYEKCFYTSKYSSNMNRHNRLRHGNLTPPSASKTSASCALATTPSDNMFPQLHAAVIPSSPYASTSLSSSVNLEKANRSAEDIESGSSEDVVDNWSGTRRTPLNTPSQRSTEASDQAFHCTKCDFSCSRIHKWRIHQFRHRQRLHCAVCSYTSLGTELMRRHYVGVHKRPAPVSLQTRSPRAGASGGKSGVECDLCQRRASSSDELSRHVQQVHVIKRCSMCSYTTVDRRQYNAHVEGHVMRTLPTDRDSESDDGEYICDSCHFRTKLRSQWKAHKCSADGARDPEQPVSYAGSDSDPDSVDTLHCRKCKLTFRTEAEFNKHKVIHVGSYRCDLCDFSAEHEQWLLVHMNVHMADEMQTPNTIERCSLCSYATVYRTRMQQHMNTHIGNRPYQCRVCSFKSSNMSNMYRHVRGRHKIFDLPTLKSYVVTDHGRRKVSGRHGGRSSTERASQLAHHSISDSSMEAPVKRRRTLSSLKSKRPLESEIVTKGKQSVDTQRHREDITGQRRLPRIFSCTTCYYTTRDEHSLAAHVTSVHHGGPQEPVPSKEQAIEADTAEADSQVKLGSYTAKLADIVQSAEGDAFADIDYAPFTRPRHPPALKLSTNLRLTSRDLLISSTIRYQGRVLPRYKCKSCGLTSLSRRSVTEHIKRAHLLNPDTAALGHLANIKPAKQYYCQRCDYQTDVTTNLRYHYRVHHPDDKTFLPDACHILSSDEQSQEVMSPPSDKHSQHAVSPSSRESEDLVEPAAGDTFYCPAESPNILYVGNKAVPLTENLSARGAATSSPTGSTPQHVTETAADRCEVAEVRSPDVSAPAKGAVRADANLD